jgi:transposase
VSLEKEVCSYGELEVFSRYRGDVRYFNNIETRAAIKFCFLQGKAPMDIYTILTETLREHAPSYTTVKNWVAQFKRSDFSTCDSPRPRRPNTVTTSEITDQIHELNCKVYSAA